MERKISWLGSPVHSVKYSILNPVLNMPLTFTLCFLWSKAPRSVPGLIPAEIELVVGHWEEQELVNCCAFHPGCLEARLGKLSRTVVTRLSKQTGPGIRHRCIQW
jgi:hypothetical protein